MLQNSHVEYSYMEQKYVVDIEDCTVMPQCYAAIAENLAEFKGMYMIADIGNGTMNVMILNNGKAMESRSWTVKMGVNQCFQAIRNLILDRKAEDIPAEIIENYLRYGDVGIGSAYEEIMEEAARGYVEQIFAELREHGYNPNLMKLYVMGGGAKIVELVGDYDREKVTFNHDIKANAKGYEYFCYMKLRRQKR
jgi:plasmid segregation protein ParM